LLAGAVAGYLIGASRNASTVTLVTTRSGGAENTTQIVTTGSGSYRLYQLEFIQESNCPYGSWLVPWGVTLDSHAVEVQPSNATLPLSYGGARLTSDSNYSTIGFSVRNGMYDYTILPKNFSGVEQNGTVTVSGGDVQVQISAFITAMGCSTTTA